jgi:endopeptidase La
MTKNLKQEILKCNILQKEYKQLSTIICDMENIIIQNENILLFTKNQVMKSLNELIKKLNESYNDSIINILSSDVILNSVQNESMYSEIPDLKSENKSEEDSDIDHDKDSNSIISDNSDNNVCVFDEDKKPEKKISKNNANPNSNSNANSNKISNKNTNKNPNNIDDNLKLSNDDIQNLNLVEQIKNISIDVEMNTFRGKYSFLYELSKYNPFDDIKKQIIMLGKIVGFTSINDIIYLSLNIKDYEFKDYDKQLIELLENIFMPLDYSILKIENNFDLKIKKIDSPHLVLFNNYCSVELCVGNNYYKINGFIKNDPLNIYIRTSQISNGILYNKKMVFEKIIGYSDSKNFDKDIISKDSFNKLQKINRDFSDVYLKNMTVTEILILSNDEFSEKLHNDYLLFNELNKIQFVKLIKNFTKDASENLYNIFNTIKLLLLGTDENCAVASLLYNLLKDKKTSGGNEYIANIIYQQLNYIGQLKLKKSTFNIKNELEKLKGITSSDIDLKKQVLLSKNMPEHVKKICLEKLEELKNANNETYKIKMYVNILIQFPWLSESDDNMFKLVSNDKIKSKLFLENIESKLNEQIYGHSLAKNKILQTLAKLISVQGTHISPIALAGPPGVGKTKFAQCLAECLDIPFVQITLGGQNDGELLHGHGYTYAGAQPGLIVKKMVDASSARCIMYFDELDKCVSKNGQVNELMSILIHLTDPMTNGSFQDRFFQEITFPLSKVIFIFSFNDISKIDKILLDRMEVIDVESYSIKEKITISNDYLLKILCKDIGFDYGSITFSQDILAFIVEEYTFEPGVRSLKRSIENILLKLNIDKIYQRGVYEGDKEFSISNPLVITKEIIQEYLGDAKVNYKIIHSKDIVGVVNGLYATSMCSGGIVPIQLTGYHVGKTQKFILKLTGNQKKIMKESVFYSFTTAINLITQEGKEQFFKKYPNGIHIHTPEAATPKDGPSAGVAFTLAFLSVILDLKINREIALTGEIDLYGNVTKIGGVKYKVQGAFKAGVKTVFLPIENKDDIDKVKKELPEIFDDQHECLFIEHVLDVAEKALIGWNDKKYLIQSNKH